MPIRTLLALVLFVAVSGYSAYKQWSATSTSAEVMVPAEENGAVDSEEVPSAKSEAETVD